MQYEKTINKILQKLSKELPIAEEGDLLETQKTLYPSGSLPREEKNIIINSTEVPKEEDKTVTVKDESIPVPANEDKDKEQ